MKLSISFFLSIHYSQVDLEAQCAPITSMAGAKAAEWYWSHEQHGVTNQLQCDCFVNRCSVEKRENIKSLHCRSCVRNPPNRAEIVPMTGMTPDNKIHGANMGPIWVLSAMLAPWTLLSGAMMNYARALQADDYEVIFGAKMSSYLILL